MPIIRHRRVVIAGAAALALFAAGCSDASDAANEALSTASSTAAEATDAAGGAASSATDSAESQKTDSAESEKEASLNDWEGNWISLGAYAKDPAMKPYADEAAKEHDESVDEILSEVDEHRKADFDGLAIGDGKINFVDDLAGVKDAKASEGSEFTFVEAKDVKTDEYEFTWYVFKGGDDAPHKYVLLMPLHGEETLAHFHMRYGDSVEEAMNADDDWYPTFVNKDEATDDQIAEALFHHDH